MTYLFLIPIIGTGINFVKYMSNKCSVQTCLGVADGPLCLNHLKKWLENGGCTGQKHIDYCLEKEKEVEKAKESIFYK